MIALSNITLDSFLQDVKFKRKKELKKLIDDIVLIHTLSKGSKPIYSVWGKQHLDRQEIIERINIDLAIDIQFYISKKSKKIARIEFYSYNVGNFDDLFFDTLNITIRNRLSDGGCQAFLFARPLGVLSDEDIFDFCKKILLFNHN